MSTYFQKKSQEVVRRRQQEGSGFSCHGFSLGKSDCDHEVWDNSDDGFDSTWYLDWIDWASQISNNRYIFVGRKGTGKSALVKHIREEQSRDKDCLSKGI